ncbi:MAG TPA: hypothetical protein V6D33_05845 [Cyanophyceae cyanobacterium]
MKKTSRKIQSGDRIYTPSGVGGTCLSFEHRLCKVKWDNGREALYTAKEIDKFGYKISVPEPETEDIAEEELSLWEQPLLISREWKVGDRVTTLPNSNWQPGELIVVEGSDPENITVENIVTGGKVVVAGRFLQAWNVSKPADSLKVSADSPVQLTLLGDSIGESQLSKAQALVRFCDRISDIPFGKEISEDSTQAGENMICSSVDSPAPGHQTQDLEQDLSIQNQGQCSENSSDALERPDPHSSFWSNLADLSIVDFEHGLEDSEWEDIKASIHSSRAAINLEHHLSGSGFLSFPTLLSGQGKKHRDAGSTKCEKWFQQSGVIPDGSQLSPEAIACLHGFPADWYRSISPPCIAQPDTQEGLLAENWAVKPSPCHKPELPSNGLNGCGQSLIKCPSCDESLLKLEDGCGVCGWSDVGIVAFDDIGDRPISLEKQSKQTGSLYQYTANRKGKDGVIREYPIVQGRERDRANDDDWYWGLSYIEKNSRGKWCDRSASIPQKSLPVARQLMREKFLYICTIEICQLKFLWREERGRYLIGEIKPEACPRLCVVSLEEKDFILAPPNWGEMRADERMALSRKIREAIADNQPLEVIRGLLL